MPLKQLLQFSASEPVTPGEPESVLVFAVSEQEAYAMIVGKIGEEAAKRLTVIQLVVSGHQANQEQEAGVSHVEPAPERSRPRTPREIYALPADDPEYEWWDLTEVLEDLNGGELNVRYDEGANTRVCARNVKYLSEDVERAHCITVLSLDDEPFAIVTRAGRGLQDHSHTYITDEGRYYDAVAHLKSLDNLNPPLKADLGLDDPCYGLNFFYGRDVFLSDDGKEDWYV